MYRIPTKTSFTGTQVWSDICLAIPHDLFVGAEGGTRILESYASVMGQIY